MTNAELIEALRYCVVHPYRPCVGCVLFGTDGCINVLHGAAADALKAADEKIADYTAAIDALDDSNDAYIKENERLKNRIAELEARLPKEGKWIRKEVKVYCPRDCWNPSACAIEGTWNETEGWNLEMQDGFCSVCGEQDEKYYKHHYCPNCGSRMRKGKQE